MKTNPSDRPLLPPGQSPRQGTLFELPEEPGPEGSAEVGAEAFGQPRLRCANRQQMEMRLLALDAMVPEDHTARAVWAYVNELDLHSLYQKILAVEGAAGRNATDPRILMALWLYATLEGVGSARQLAKLCVDHVAYQWICGGVSTNYHTLADFRVAHGELLNDLLTRSVAGLIHEGLADMNRVAQDGMRVRASAGAASFRRGETLQECLKQAEEQVARLRAELDSDPAEAMRRQQASRERAARERAERVRKALEQLPEVEAKKKAKDREKARVSTTDPDARVMKMGDGGFRPAFNVELSTDTASQVIVGAEVVNAASDQGQLAPMVEQIETRYDETPAEVLVDGGFVKKEDIDALSPPQGGTKVYAPVMESKDPNRDRHEPREDDSPAVAEWRVRMGTPEAKEIYKQRASTAECVNAIARNRNLQQFRVRGLAKVRCVVLWYVLAHNLMRALTLRALAGAMGG